MNTNTSMCLPLSSAELRGTVCVYGNSVIVSKPLYLSAVMNSCDAPSKMVAGSGKSAIKCAASNLKIGM